MATTVASRGVWQWRRRSVPYVLLFPGLLWLGIFYLWPTIQMFFVSLQTGSLERGFTLTWNWGVYGQVLSSYNEPLVRSVVYGLIVTMACLVISYPLAYFIA